MTTIISALASAPDAAKGFVKDLRVRWALEETGAPYTTDLRDWNCPPDDPYRDRQPFGQVPDYRDEEVEMFESGAIVLHLATRSEALAPSDIAGCRRAWSWAFAAVTTVQWQVDDHNHWRAHLSPEMQPEQDRYLFARLDALERRLKTRDYLEDQFTVGDLLMTTVLRELVEDGTLARYPALTEYIRRCEARPAFQRALQAQLDDFRD